MVRFTESEEAWLARRAAKIAAEKRWPLPMARSEAMVELVRNRMKPKADVIPLPRK